MVVFTNGLADKREYRKFKMRAGGNDDYLHMKEVLTRRFSSRNAKWPKPELILIDGGKGQLSAAIQVVNELTAEASQPPIPIISIAKRDEEIMISRTGSNVKLDWIWQKLQLPPDNEIEIREEGDFIAINLHKHQTHSRGHARNLLGETSAEYSDLTKLFQRIRDESHRFAINYHSSLRAKSQTKNILEEIEGIGPKTRAKLLRKFGSLKKIKEASESEIAQVVGEKSAQNVKEFLKNQA
jgi:excinuclease ABC subunit C